MSTLLDQETVMIEALEFDVECWHEAHPATWSITCRTCGHGVFLCDPHLAEQRAQFEVSLKARRNPRCLTCSARGRAFDALFAVVAI